MNSREALYQCIYSTIFIGCKGKSGWNKPGIVVERAMRNPETKEAIQSLTSKDALNMPFELGFAYDCKYNERSNCSESMQKFDKIIFKYRKLEVK